jgi:hypothetical protein
MREGEKIRMVLLLSVLSHVFVQPFSILVSRPPSLFLSPSPPNPAYSTASLTRTLLDDDCEEDKYRLESDIAGAENYTENKVYSGVQDVENLPSDAARWTGRKVQDVEDIPQDIEYDYDRAKYRVEDGLEDAAEDVEDAPEDVAEWVGDKVGGVERFGDGIEDAYDQGRDEGRDDRW